MDIDQYANNDEFNWTTDEEGDYDTDFSQGTQLDYDTYYDTEDELVDLTQNTLFVSPKNLKEKYNKYLLECIYRFENLDKIKYFTFEIMELRTYLQNIKNVIYFIRNHYKLDQIINEINNKNKLVEIIKEMDTLHLQPIPLNEQSVLRKSILIFQNLFSLF